MKKFDNIFSLGTYILLFFAISMVLYILWQYNKSFNGIVSSFFEIAENRTFDCRQWIKVKHKKPIPSKDIVVLAIDDPSLEMLWDKYGEWPIPRNVYSDIIEYIEQQDPKAIAFDLMFIKSNKSSIDADNRLIASMNKYNNIYTGMNFDEQPAEVRKPITLPNRISLNLKNESNINFKNSYSFSNCRPILNGLLDGKVNIGILTLSRNDDGIIRNVHPVLGYKDKFYPYLGFLIGNNVKNYNSKDIFIDKNKNLKFANVNIPLTANGATYLNWYGESKTHKTIPMYRVINDIDKGKTTLDFKNKIVLIGTTADALHDNKSTPVDSVYPGVEVHATFINNILDNNFITKSDKITNTLICIAVIALIGCIVMLSSSTIFAILSTVLFALAYMFISYYVMEIANLWIPLVLPEIVIVFSFAVSILVKYLIKSRDFEHQYKLATVDGLTDLYNHRYFQETLRKQISISKRYNQKFSLIITDIDFFKKFNDTYGHQSGDAVLRQVAQVLKKNSRITDYVCRYGGEEMSIILPNTSKEEALFLANRILNAVSEKSFQLNATEKGHVTISVGVSTFPENSETPEGLVDYADKGLYYAKEHGRNQIGKSEEE